MIYYAASIWLLLVLWIIWEASRAPEGYEDETGFHRK